MKSLSELADTHEKWATANEAVAAEILCAWILCPATSNSNSAGVQAKSWPTLPH